ncbi:MAG TPA: CocE/NonD family hydrolase [Gemmatimonadales bacterium]
MHLAASLSTAVIALAALPPGARARAPDSVPAFAQTGVMIPMRDGVRLHTLGFAPKGATEPLPLLLTRTPYGIEGSLKRIGRSYAERGSGWYTWLTEDQRFVDNRPDVLTWRTEPLPQDVTIAGNIAAELFAATTGSDAHWVAKLIDVYPDRVEGNSRMGGYELMVARDILRGRYRTGFDHPTPIRSGAIEAYRVDLHQQSYRFQRGHRIMVQVQSTWFPLYDRNPQTFVRNIFEARPADFRPATERVYRSAAHPSHATLPVLAE